MKRKYLPLLRLFVEMPFIPRTAESDATFEPLAEMDLIEPTLSHCWKLSARGQDALDEDMARQLAAKLTPVVKAGPDVQSEG